MAQTWPWHLQSMLRATQVNLLSHLQTQEELQTRGGDRVPNARTLKTASARSAK